MFINRSTKHIQQHINTLPISKICLLNSCNSKQPIEYVLTLWNLTFTAGQENEDEKTESKGNFIKQNREDNPRNKKKATGDNMRQFKQDKELNWRGQGMHQIMRS